MKKSLTKKISTIVMIMVICSTLTIGAISYFLYYRESIAFSVEKARSISVSVASAIDPIQFTEIMETNTKNQYWYDTREFVDQVKTQTDIMYLYILDKKYSDTVKYFIEGSTPDETDALDLGYEDSADSYADEMYTAINTGLPTVTDIYNSEGYGMMVSGFAPVLDGNNHVVGVVGIDILLNDIIKSSTSFGMMVLICVVVFSALFWFISRSYIMRNMGKPIAAFTAASGKIARGDMEVDLSIHSDDEIGALSVSFTNMVESTKSQVAILEKIAGGDLTAEITPRSERDLMSFAMQRMITNLNKMFSDIRGSTLHVSSGAGQIANASQTLAQGAAEQSATVEHLEGSLNQVYDKTKESTVMAGRAAELATIIKGNAEKGSVQMEQMMSAVREINEASGKISKVIKVIDDIAFQTNILALNAAVEAARAGQHGKGFAVVADEVRNLASKSAEAAKNTGSLITNSIEKAEYGVRIADETATSLTEIVSGINESNEIIKRIAGFSEEQNKAIAEINTDIEHVVQVIHQNSATAQESAASSEELSSQAMVLQELVAKFKIYD